jgi:endonuclease/exonuclease/phosphatase family metal-dependent hydrolase
MFTKIVLAAFIAMSPLAILSAKSKLPLRVMTYNVRMDTKIDNENQWSNRKDFAASLIRFHEIDLFGSQEVLHNQLEDLLSRLPEFDYIGVGREDGKTKGEYSPIFYKKDRFKVIKSGHFWLSEDIQAVGKKGWDAACERVATWAIFKDKKNGNQFFMLNTHLDHIGKVARHKGAELVLSQMKALAGTLPVIITGDFNAIPSDDPIKVLTNASDPNHLTHTRDVAALRYGPEWTFHDFGRIPLAERGWYDYIFIKGNYFNVVSHGVLTDTMNELYPSDHCPVMATLTIR